MGMSRLWGAGQPEWLSESFDCLNARQQELPGGESEAERASLPAAFLMRFYARPWGWTYASEVLNSP